MTVGILLAGGRSTRYGSPKAFAKWQGKYFYEWVYEALAAVCDHVVIVALEELEHRFPARLHVVTDCDPYKGNGPLAGIYTAMLERPADRYLVLPCDMPCMSSAGLTRLLAETRDAPAYAVEWAGSQYPLVSCWQPSMVASLREALEQRQYGVIRLLNKAGAVWLAGGTLFEDAEHALQNWNRPDQIR